MEKDSVAEYRRRAILLQKRIINKREEEIGILNKKIADQKKMINILNRLYLGKKSYWEEVWFLIKEIFKIR